MEPDLHTGYGSDQKVPAPTGSARLVMMKPMLYVGT